MLTSDEFKVKMQQTKENSDPTHTKRLRDELADCAREVLYICPLSSAETENDVSTAVHDENL